jgi:UDP-GlcNAc:undecaprenyl-phosphate GlcNAc-1-phosphate transferase
LLALNFDHYEAVIIIYLAQAIFVVSAVLLRYHSDLMVISVWLLANLALAFSLVMAGRMQWHAHPEGAQSVFAKLLAIGKGDFLRKMTLVILLAGVSLLLVAGPVLTGSVDRDFGITAAGLFLLLLLRLLLGSRVWFISLRLLMFVAIAFVLYLVSEYPSSVYPIGEGVEYAYFGIIIAALVIGARATDKDVFQATPMDFLIILIMIGMTLIPQARAGEEYIIHLVVKMCIMFYAMEFLLRCMKGRWNIPVLSALWALGVIAVRGLVL